MSILDRIRTNAGAAGVTVQLLLLLLVEFVRGAFLVAYLPTYASEKLNFSLSVIGLAVSLHYLMDNGVKVFAGYLLDRFSSRNILFAGMMLSLVSMLLVVNARSEGLLLLSTALLGIGGSPVWLVCLRSIRENNRASQMSLLYLFWMCGLALGPVAMNFLMDMGEHLVFFSLVGLLAVCTLMSLAVPNVRHQQPSIRKSFANQLKMLWERFTKTGFLLPGMILQTTAGGLLIPLLSPFATKQIGLSHSELSLSLIAGGATAALILVPAGRWVDKLGGRWFLIGGFGIFGIAVFALTFSDSFTETILFAMILGASYASLLPAWNAYLARFVPEEYAGAGWGLISTIEGIGVVAGPALGGWMAERINEALPFWMAAVIFACIACYYIIAKNEL
ncbi:putative MFS family arabinose efflux permease [Paenibacillus taihuensis]|uniref:Putative MFS family arabinose efflux permease n=1 Tax=Paenibacillus taihuensis TaxID=1156355 RepID=A0A3D9S8K8_9BACL|nr:MFS transporter [Paenibacillus taihuensis]REE89055.1 putative MFS family arabinose efflux permease [Paenibacillus taihuensis]